MKKIPIFLLALLFFLSALGSAFADKSISVDRVRWKKSFLVWTDHEEYPEWKNEDIWTEYRKNTYVAKYWQPSVTNVRNMIIIIAGQQGSSGSTGCENCLTGQDSTWDDDWGTGDKSKTAYLNDLSLAGRIINSGVFTSSNTFLSVVFNSNFNWENTSSAKIKAEKAFTNWFLKHGSYLNVDRIFLLGSSRGGTLATRMAKKIKEKSGWSDVPVYLGIIDAVPNTLQDEINTANQPKCYNPLNSSYYSRYADLTTFFAGLNTPSVLHIITGAPVILDIGVHSYCYTNTWWYSQVWVNYEHTEIGRCNSKTGDPYDPGMMNAGIVPLFNWMLSK